MQIVVFLVQGAKGSINFGLDLAWPLFLFKAGAFFKLLRLPLYMSTSVHSRMNFQFYKLIFYATEVNYK